jgi:hypothetical protein
MTPEAHNWFGVARSGEFREQFTPENEHLAGSFEESPSDSCTS